MSVGVPTVVIWDHLVPLICRAMLQTERTSRTWQHGLHMLNHHSLHEVMPSQVALWIPIVIEALHTSLPIEMRLAAMKILCHQVEAIRSHTPRLLGPLQILTEELVRDTTSKTTAYLELCARVSVAARMLDIEVPTLPAHDSTLFDSDSRPRAGDPQIKKRHRRPRDHPQMADIVEYYAPKTHRMVQQAWRTTLLNTDFARPTAWLDSLYLACVRACGVQEIALTLRLESHIHKDVFHTAFLFCYLQIADDHDFKLEIDTALADLCNGDAPTEIVLVLLELFAFLHKQLQPVPTLVTTAASRYALALLDGRLHRRVPSVVLWHAEQVCSEDPTYGNIEKLIEANLRVGQKTRDAAWSSMMWYKDEYGQEPNIEWLLQLRLWKDASERQDEPDAPEVSPATFKAHMICYHAMGQYERGLQLAQDTFDSLEDGEKEQIAYWCTGAAWHMGEFGTMAEYLVHHPKGASKSLYKAIVLLHHEEYAQADRQIAKAQAAAYDDLYDQLFVVPDVSVRSLAKSEMLLELQEVIQYRLQPTKRQGIIASWKDRFEKSHPDCNTWLKRLAIWDLACPPTTVELQSCYLECAKLCESMNMSEVASHLLLSVTPEYRIPGCKVEYLRLRFEWRRAAGSRSVQLMSKTLSRMTTHTIHYAHHMGIDWEALRGESLGTRPLTAVMKASELDRKQLARRIYRLAQWTERLQGKHWVSDPWFEVFGYYSLVCKLDDLWYNGAYSMAQVAISLFEAKEHDRSNVTAVNHYIVPAIRALFQAVRSRETSEKTLKALLRLITVWFSYGSAKSVVSEFHRQAEDTPPDVWLAVIPQLISRLATREASLQNSLLTLLTTLAYKFPHSLIWPLVAASQTRISAHNEAAHAVLTSLSGVDVGLALVEQSRLVAVELARTSYSPLERWIEIVDRCLPRHYLMEVDWAGVPAQLSAEIDRISRPETPQEDSFFERHGGKIKKIYDGLLVYSRTGDVDLLLETYKKLFELLKAMRIEIAHWSRPEATLHLRHVAPRLVRVTDWALVIPGRFDPARAIDEQAFIESFEPIVELLSSKMRPRKVNIRSRSSSFTFLLKGNEDLRGDERIMQLLSLVNTLLNYQQDAFERNLHLLPYKVIPLSPSAGLIEWVYNTQQLQGMIQDNRGKSGTIRLTNMEMGCLTGHDSANFAPTEALDVPGEMVEFENLPIDMRVQRLAAAMSLSDQSDLKEVLWQRSMSSDVWIRRRANFARTLGLGSIVGYLVGLGDRHGSNILVEQLTWSALHIDFGDLFGVAQERSILPEMVPFRLTRMMTNAFELAAQRPESSRGTRGTFIQAGYLVLDILREHIGPFMALLEAFLHDPLLGWTMQSEPSNDTSISSWSPAEPVQSSVKERSPSVAKDTKIAASELPGSVCVDREHDPPTSALPASFQSHDEAGRCDRGSAAIHVSSREKYAGTFQRCATNTTIAPTPGNQSSAAKGDFHNKDGIVNTSTTRGRLGLQNGTFSQSDTEYSPARAAWSRNPSSAAPDSLDCGVASAHPKTSGPMAWQRPFSKPEGAMKELTACWRGFEDSLVAEAVCTSETRTQTTAIAGINTAKQRPHPDGLKTDCGNGDKDDKKHTHKFPSTTVPNAKGAKVFNDILKRLTGHIADGTPNMDVEEQVQYLVSEATNMENLAQGYVLGWLPHW